jgi:hypothetical protein
MANHRLPYILISGSKTIYILNYLLYVANKCRSYIIKYALSVAALHHTVEALPTLDFVLRNRVDPVF